MTFRSVVLGGSILLSLALSAPGCLTNNLGDSTGQTASGSRSDSGVDSGDPFSGTTGGGSSSTLLTLSRVVPAANNPGSDFDLHGDGTNAIRQFCQPSSGGNGGSTCACAFSYTDESGQVIALEAQTNYTEANMIRCTYGDRRDVPFVKVRIHVTSADLYSNEVTFRFASASNVLDVSDPATFVAARRYQCRDAPYIPFLLDTASGLYDPLLADDPKISYPLNFYTTNMGRTFALMASKDGLVPAGKTGWICPPMPNDSSYGLDLTLYSRAPDSGGAKRIFPPTGSVFDRSTFYVARQQTGIFNVPFHAFVYPGKTTVLPDPKQPPDPGAHPPLGFAAAATRFSDDEEACPETSVVLPTGFQWVKLWAFRAPLDPRKFESSSKVPQLNIACNPGAYGTDNPGAAGSTTSSFAEAIIPGCRMEPPGSSAPDIDKMRNPGIGRLAGVADESIADRAIGIQGSQGAVCVRVDPGGTTIGPSSVAGAVEGPVGVGATWAMQPGFSNWPPGADIWNNSPNGTEGSEWARNGKPARLSNKDHTIIACGDGSSPSLFCELKGDTGSGCGGSGQLDAMGICTTGLKAPIDQTPTMGEIEPASRFDVVYVVTPPSIMTYHFVRDLAAAQPYKPYRFFATTDCQSQDPDNPTFAGDCPSNREVVYGFENRDPTRNDTISVNDPARSRTFPLCVIQPK